MCEANALSRLDPKFRQPLVKRISGRRTRRIEDPCTLGAASTAKARLVNPHHLARHCRIIPRRGLSVTVHICAAIVDVIKNPVQENARTDRKVGLIKKSAEALTRALCKPPATQRIKSEQFCTDSFAFALISFPPMRGKYECISHFGG